MRDLAAWYRAFAELARSPDERQRRAADADDLDGLARAHETGPGELERRS